MSSIIVINSSHATNIKSVFEYRFLQGSYNIPQGSTISLRQVVIPYSWFNINQAVYFNGTFQYTWNGATTITRTVTLAAGYYTVSNINQALQLDMIAAGLFLIDGNGNNVYYLEILTNVVQYANQILAFATPASLPAGFTAPSNINANFYSATFRTPQFIIRPLIDSTFSSIVGFIPATYPPSISTVSVSLLGNTTPNATPVNSVIMRCNLVDNAVSFPSDIIDSFTMQNVPFGTNAVYSPNYDSSVNLKAGRYNSFRIEFVDQNFNALPMIDTNLIITLAIQFPKV